MNVIPEIFLSILVRVLLCAALYIGVSLYLMPVIDQKIDLSSLPLSESDFYSALLIGSSFIFATTAPNIIARLVIFPISIPFNLVALLYAACVLKSDCI